MWQLSYLFYLGSGDLMVAVVFMVVVMVVVVFVMTVMGVML